MQGWLEQRKELYRQLKVQVGHLLGPESAGLKKYRQEYDKNFNQKWFPIQRKDFLHSIELASVVLLADFHALQQSQKAQLRILKSTNPKKKRILCVECVEARHQKQIDAYLCGKISEFEFLRSIAWQHSWGFPWEFYKPLFVWARKNKVAIHGVNYLTKAKSASSLAQRDQFAAKRIAELMKIHPDHQMIVVYGDLHLAESHLPKALFKKVPGLQRKDISTVFQNSEKIYFDILAGDRETDIEIVRLKSNQYCLLSIPPWVKWQSYLLYIESQFDSALEQEGLDFTDHLESYCQLLKKDLGLEFASGNFSVYSAADDLIFEKLNEIFGGYQKKWFEYLIEASKSFYVPELKVAFLGRPSVNSAASLAMAILHSQSAKLETSFYRMPEDFTRLIFSEAIQYFGSKLINPKRKTDTVADIRASFAARGSVREGRESLALALAQKMKELLHVKSPGSRVNFEMPSVKRKSSYYEAARILGGMMGEKLFNGYRQKLISEATMRKILKQSLHSEHFKEFYAEMLELVDALPEPFQSKAERV